MIGDLPGKIKAGAKSLLVYGRVDLEQLAVRRLLCERFYRTRDAF